MTGGETVIPVTVIPLTRQVAVIGVSHPVEVALLGTRQEVPPFVQREFAEWSFRGGGIADQHRLAHAGDPDALPAVARSRFRSSYRAHQPGVRGSRARFMSSADMAVPTL